MTEKTIESEARATARIVLVPLSPCGSVLLSLVNAIDVLELCGLAEHNTHATVACLSKLDCPFHRLGADMVTGDDVLDQLRGEAADSPLFRNLDTGDSLARVRAL